MQLDCMCGDQCVWMQNWKPEFLVVKIWGDCLFVGVRCETVLCRKLTNGLVGLPVPVSKLEA